MELDDLKKQWESVTNETIKQNNLTLKIIDQMIHKKYNSKIRKIIFPELTGGIICLLAVIFIVYNFNQLDTTLLQTIGVITILLLMTLPAISFLSVTPFNLANDLSKPYVEIIKRFAVYRIRFQKYQQVNAFLSYLLLVTIIILLPKFSSGKDITGNKYFWIFAFSFGYIFLAFFSKWVKKFYNNSLQQAEDLLKEIEF